MTDPQQPQPGGDELDSILKKAVGENQYDDGDISYMPDDALDGAKAAINAYILAEVLALLPKRLGITAAPDEYARQAALSRNGIITEIEQAAIARFGKGER